MAFAYTILKRLLVGDMVRSYGTFTNGASDSGGNIDTMIDRVLWMKLQHSGAVVVGSEPAINETIPCDGHAVTIVTVAGADGYWEAEGEGW